MLQSKHSKILFEDEFDKLNNIKLSDTNINNNEKIINNLIILSKYYSKLHLLSYLYLKERNKYLLLIFICSSFISGLFEIINYTININENIYLISGIIEIFLSLILVTYKNLKIPETQQDHYHYSNEYKILYNKVNICIYTSKSSHFIYADIVHCINDLSEKINNLISNSPNIPDYILLKYKIKKIDYINNQTSNIDLNTEKSFTNILDIYRSNVSFNDNLNDNESDDIDNNQDVNLNKYSSIFSEINSENSKNMQYISELTEEDIKNYNNFIKNLNLKRRDEERNKKLKRFNLFNN